MTQEQQLSAALSLVAVNANEQTCHLIISVYEEIKASNDFSLSKAIEIKSANLAKYATEPPIVPHEVESGEQKSE